MDKIISYVEVKTMATLKFKKYAIKNLAGRGFYEIEIIGETPANYSITARVTDMADEKRDKVKLVAPCIYSHRAPHFRMTKKEPITEDA